MREENKPEEIVLVVDEGKHRKLMNLYPYIVAWCQFMGSFGYFIEDQVALAIKEKAPKNAISKSPDGTWSTIESIKNPEIRGILEDYKNGERGGIVPHWHSDTVWINNQIYYLDGEEAMTEWKGFKKWVENTTLFEALKKDPSGTEIRSTDGSLVINLSKDHPVNEAEDLGIEILYNFYVNSPWYTKPNNNLQKFLTV